MLILLIINFVESVERVERKIGSTFLQVDKQKKASLFG
mgnify:CR=1 FL=1